jgi:putative spermidine/putrescine transport system substrate-binding protein/putrescine transport system substrate-binding protein
LVLSSALLLYRGDKPSIPCEHLFKELSSENFGPFDDEKLLYLNAGIDYIPYELIELFEKLTGINVIVDIFDSNEMLEAKLLAGDIKYDVVFPTAWPHFSRQIGAGIYKKIDKTKIDYRIFDKDILAMLARNDINNDHAVPFQFGISGIGINEKIVNSIVKNPRDKGLSIIFDPTYAEKLSKYRISVYESSEELFPVVLAFLGLDPETEKEEDIQKAFEHLKKIRKYISKFTSYGFEDLAAENACVTLSAAGDIFRVKCINPNVKFLFPKEGGPIWVDVAAIPINAEHTNNIYAFFRFLFHPRVIGYATNCKHMANAVTKSAKYVNPEIISNVDIYPSADIRKKCYIEKPSSASLGLLKTRLLTKIKSMDSGNEF